MNAVSTSNTVSAVSAVSVSDSKDAPSASGEASFGRVLAKEVGRKEGEAHASVAKQGAAEPAKEQALAEDNASNWLQMLQQINQVILPAANPLVQDKVALDSVAEEPQLALDSNAAQAGLLQAASGLIANKLVPTADAGSATASTLGGKGLPLMQNIQLESHVTEELDVALLGKNLSEVNTVQVEAGDDASDFSAQVGALVNQSRSSTQVTEPTSTLPQRMIAEPVGNARWGDAVAQQVTIMLGRQEQQMDMQLNPPHLGPMEVRLTMGSEQASIVFTSQHAAVREALAAATPKLTALLADQGIQLVNVQVASDSLNQHAQEQARQQFASSDTRSGGHDSYRSLIEGQEIPRTLTGVSIPVARSGVSLYV